MNRWKCIGNEEVSRKSPKRSQFALALVYEWFAVRTRNGEIELENEAKLWFGFQQPSEGVILWPYDELLISSRSLHA